jgi:hypothetical protein
MDSIFLKGIHSMYLYRHIMRINLIFDIFQLCFHISLNPHNGLALQPPGRMNVYYRLPGLEQKTFRATDLFRSAASAGYALIFYQFGA